jgi:predicted alpha/beta hydrolase family esterase
MLTSTIGFSTQPNAVHAYAKNVGTAARDFVSALLAIKPATEANEDNQPAHSTQGAPLSDEYSLFRLYCLASRSNSYDSVSPALANELRMIAARG